MKTSLIKMNEAHDKISAFMGGGIFGLWGGFRLLGVPINDLYLEYPLKIFGTIVLSAIGGLVGLIIKDLYVIHIKHKIFKNKK